MTPEQASRLTLAEQHAWYRRFTSRRALLRSGVAGGGTLIAGPARLGGPAAAGLATAGTTVAGTTAAGTTAAGTTARRRPASPMLLAKSSWISGSAVPPFGRHLAYGSDPASQISVAWQVPVQVSDPFIRVGTTPWDLGERIGAEVRALTTQVSDTRPVDSVPPSAPATVEQFYLHARLTGLRPGHTYFYSLGHRGWDASQGLAAIGSFNTAPAGRIPFTFTAFGDQGVSYHAVGTSALIRAQNPAFHLHAGDVSYAESGGRGLVTDSYDPRVWDSFFTEIESAAASIPWQVAVGNHEMEAWYSPDGYGGQHARFDFPGDASGAARPAYYSFVYGNVGIVSLDANDVSFEIPANHGYTGGAQVAWLARTLAGLRRQPDVDFIVAYFHHCAYCTCAVHGSEGGARQFFVPLFDQFGVDLVINGHNHIYERTDPLRGGVSRPAPIGSTVRPATEGTTYIAAGGAGVGLYDFDAPDSYQGHVRAVPSVPSFVNEAGGTTITETVTWSQTRFTGYCLLVMDSKPGWRPGAPSTLTVRGLSEDGSEVDRVILAR